MTTTVLRSMTLKKEALTEDEDKVKMAPTWANTKRTRDEVETMTTRAVTKDKMGMMEARAAAKMSGQGEMPTVDTMEGDSQVGRNGDDLTNGAGTHPVSTPATVQIVGRMTDHGRNFTSNTEGDVTRQALECNFTWYNWYTQQSRMLLGDIVGKGEKTLMTMCNEHVITYAGLGQPFKSVVGLCGVSLQRSV